MKSSIPAKKVFIILGGAFLLFLVLCLGIVLFALWGGGGEPATLNVATRVSQEFIEHIHNEQTELAYSMLSEKFSPYITIDQFEELIHQDENIFRTYRKLDICDWGFYISDGRVLDASGLLSYEDGAIVVQLSLHKDEDAVWRIQGFRFRPDIEPKPFGLCQ